jgi:hypothetical protein
MPLSLGFKDRCVYQFHHAPVRVLTTARSCPPLKAGQGRAFVLLVGSSASEDDPPNALLIAAPPSSRTAYPPKMGLASAFISANVETWIKLIDGKAGANYVSLR